MEPWTFVHHHGKGQYRPAFPWRLILRAGRIHGHVHDIHTNFRGEGQRLDLNLQIGTRAQNVSLGFMEPWAFNTPTTLEGRVYYQKYTYYSNMTQYGFSGTASRRLKWPDDYFSASAGYTLEWREDANLQDTVYPNAVHIKPRGVNSRLSLSLWRDDTDMPKFPSQGSRFPFLRKSPGSAAITSFCGRMFHIIITSHCFGNLCFRPNHCMRN